MLLVNTPTTIRTRRTPTAYAVVAAAIGLTLAMTVLGLVAPADAAAKAHSRTTIKTTAAVKVGVKPKVVVVVKRKGKPATGKVILKRVGKVLKRGKLHKGRVVFRLPKQTRAGKLKLVARYQGNANTKPSATKKTITVKAAGVTLPQAWTKNCTAFNEHFPHGVGKRGAKDHTSGTPVTSFKVSTQLYNAAMSNNKGLDRDHDGIACESA